jgi:hypothetical protein
MGWNYRSEDAFPREWFWVFALVRIILARLVVVICRKGKSEGEKQLQSKLEKESVSNANNLHPSFRPSCSSHSPLLFHRVYPQLVASDLLLSSLCKTR